MKKNVRLIFVICVLIVFGILIFAVLTTYPKEKTYSINKVNDVFSDVQLSMEDVIDSKTYEIDKNVMVSYQLTQTVDAVDEMRAYFIKIEYKEDYFIEQVERMYQVMNEQEKEIFDEYYAPVCSTQNYYLFYELKDQFHLAIYDQDSDSLFYILVHKN